MPPLATAMTFLRDIFVASLNYVFRGRFSLKALLAFWSSDRTTPAVPVTPHDAGAAKPGSDPVADFLAAAEVEFLKHISNDGLRRFARQLKRQFLERLRSSPECMLPSYTSQLPRGDESGVFLALDVGGSTLRVALVRLHGYDGSATDSSILRMKSFKIDSGVRELRGTKFFDWMAERIHLTVAKDVGQSQSPQGPLLAALAWSFPIEQTETGGKLAGMGKGFRANEGLVGQDLGDIIKAACQRKGLHVELSAIVNDSSAALLSEAYIDPSTRFSLILGTGVNIAVHLPVSTMGLSKFSDRPSSWHEKASHVIVNTELGMFGHDILPLTRWDKLLKKDHPRPDFQPLEQLVSGYYLGEICRLALVDAIPTTGILGGIVPPSLQERYSLDTETISLMESDTSPTLTTALATFTARHPSPGYTPTLQDALFIRRLASLIARRSASVVAASLFALWELRAEAETELLATLPASSPFAAETDAEVRIAGGKTTVAFNGSVVEQYPGYRGQLQGFVDGLLSGDDQGGEDVREVVEGNGEAAKGTVKVGERALNGGEKVSIALVEAKESSLRGAAVALALARLA